MCDEFIFVFAVEADPILFFSLFHSSSSAVLSYIYNFYHIYIAKIIFSNIYSIIIRTRRLYEELRATDSVNQNERINDRVSFCWADEIENGELSEE